MVDIATPTIIRAPRSAEHPYFACRRAPAQDEALSWEARGVLWYLLSKPDDWIILESDLMRGGDQGGGLPAAPPGPHDPRAG